MLLLHSREDDRTSKESIVYIRETRSYDTCRLDHLSPDALDQVIVHRWDEFIDIDLSTSPIIASTVAHSRHFIVAFAMPSSTKRLHHAF